MLLTTHKIQEIYLAYFGRPADPVGLAYWQSQSDLAEVANAFAQSAEYQSLYASDDHVKLVTNIYQNLFNRPAEASGLDYWVEQLTDGNVRPGDVARAILAGAVGSDASVINAKLDAAQVFTETLGTATSAAAYKGNGPAAEARKAWATISDDATASAVKASFPALINTLQTYWVDGVQKIYVAYFGRPADPAGLNYWVEQAIANQGDWNAIAEQFANSPESQKLYGNSSNAELVKAIYLNVLGRTPDPTGEQYWLDQLDSGTVTPVAMALAVANGVKGADATTLAQRIDAANAFTLELDTAGRSDDFTGVGVTAAAREWLYGIGPDQDDYDAAFASIPNLVNAFVKGQVQGVVVNGYVADATVFIDENANGKLDTGEVSVTSDAKGNFLFPEGSPQGTVVAFGGTNISTGQPNTATLRAPAGATAVTPLTSLVQQMIDSGLAAGPEQAENLLFGALGLPKVDLSAFDPLKTALSGSDADKAIALQIEAATIQVANTLATGSALLQGTGLSAGQAQSAMLKTLTQSVSGGSGVDLAQSSTLQTMLQQAVGQANLSPDQQIQANNAIAAVSQVLGEINDRTAKAADAFSSGTTTNPVSTISDMFKLATLTQTEVISVVEQTTSSGDTTELTNKYTGEGLTENVDEVKAGSIDPDTPSDDGTDLTNGSGTPPSNASPVGVADTLAASEDTAVTYTAAQLLGNDTDANGDTLSIKSVTAGTGGTVVLNANGSVTFTPAANFNGPASFAYVATDGQGGDSAATAVTVNVAAVNDAPTGAVTIVGTATTGQTLTAANTLADVDGLGTVNYQWQSDGSAINGATASVYVLQAADVGKKITVVASYIDGQGTAESVASAATATVLEPTTITTQLDSTPGAAGSPITYNASAGQYVFHDDVNVSSYAAISGFGPNDTVALTSNAQNLLAVSSQGNNVTLSVNQNGNVSSIVLQNVIGNGEIIYDWSSFNALPVGDITFNGRELPQGSNLDNLGGTLSAPVSLDASNGSFVFSDNTNMASVVRISNFDAYDSLLWQNATASQVAVSSKGSDVTLVVNKGGTVSSVTLVDIVLNGTIVYDIDSFNTLPVGDVTFL